MWESEGFIAQRHSRILLFSSARILWVRMVIISGLCLFLALPIILRTPSRPVRRVLTSSRLWDDAFPRWDAAPVSHNSKGLNRDNPLIRARLIKRTPACVSRAGNSFKLQLAGGKKNPFPTLNRFLIWCLLFIPNTNIFIRTSLTRLDCSLSASCCCSPSHPVPQRPSTFLPGQFQQSTLTSSSKHALALPQHPLAMKSAYLGLRLLPTPPHQCSYDSYVCSSIYKLLYLKYPLFSCTILLFFLKTCWRDQFCFKASLIPLGFLHYLVLTPFYFMPAKTLFLPPTILFLRIYVFFFLFPFLSSHHHFFMIVSISV